MTSAFRSARVLLTPLLMASLLACRSAEESMDKPTRPIEAVLAEHAPSLMAIDGVVAVGQSVGKDGTPCIRVFLKAKDPAAMKRIPSRIEGHPVDVVVSGEIRAMPEAR